MVRVIGSEGDQLGVLATPDAIERAQEEGFDLVEVAPGSDPPTCRIMDYGRYRYEQQKKKKAGKAKGHAASLKEVKMRPRTDDHDLEFLHTAVLGFGVVDPLGAYVEYVGVLSSDSGTDYQALFSTGLTFGLSENVVLDGGTRIGLTKEADDVTVFAGITVRF